MPIRKKRKIDEAEVMKFGFLGGMAEAVYILFLVLFLSVIRNAFPGTSTQVIEPILFLLAFVFSAGVSAILIFGYPLYMAIQQRYVESLMTAVTSLLTLAIIGILMFMLLSFV